MTLKTLDIEKGSDARPQEARQPERTEKVREDCRATENAADSPLSMDQGAGPDIPPVLHPIKAYLAHRLINPVSGRLKI